jgi:hypothetical protein
VLPLAFPKVRSPFLVIEKSSFALVGVSVVVFVSVVAPVLIIHRELVQQSSPNEVVGGEVAAAGESGK